MPAADDPLPAAYRTVLEVPLHQALGVTYAEPDDPAAGLLLPVQGLALNPARVLHGGLAPTLLDVSAFLRVLPLLDPGTNAVTHSASCSLLRAVPEGATVRFTGRVDRRGRSLLFCSAEAVDDAGRLVATGQIVKSVVPLA